MRPLDHRIPSKIPHSFRSDAFTTRDSARCPMLWTFSSIRNNRRALHSHRRKSLPTDGHPFRKFVAVPEIRSSKQDVCIIRLSASGPLDSLPGKPTFSRGDSHHSCTVINPPVSGHVRHGRAHTLIIDTAYQLKRFFFFF